MRMWMCNPSIMCRNHLLGEHNELHMLSGTLRRGHSIRGFLANGLLEPQHINARHDTIAQEMLARGYNHRSPLPECRTDLVGHVNVEKSIADLVARCPECARTIKSKGA